jgi:hypothetical protein
MRSTGRTRRGALLPVAAVLASVAIAACGGSSNSGKTTTSKNAAATSTSKSSASRTAFTTCLKQHGVTLPKGRGGFGRFRGGTGTTPSGTSTSGVTITTPSGASSGGAPPNGGGFPGGGPGAGGGGGAGPFGGGFAGGNSKFAKAMQACRSKLPAGSFGQGRFGRGTGTHRFALHFSTAALKSYVACIRKNGDPSMPEPSSSSKTPFPASAESNPKFQAANAKCERILLRHAFRGTIAPGQSTIITATSTTSST